MKAINEKGKIISLRLLQSAKQINEIDRKQVAPQINHPGSPPVEKAKTNVFEIEPYRIEKELLALSNKLWTIVMGKQPGK